MRLTGLLLLATITASALAEEPKEFKESELAKAFGSAPLMRGVRLAPDGRKISALQVHPSGITVARVINLADGKDAVVASGEVDQFDVSWCEWANDERLLCGLRGVAALPNGLYIPTTRFIATAADGTELKVLLENQLRNRFTQFQDRVIDWLPDDREHVLVAVPGEQGGSGVGRLNIYTGEVSNAERVRLGASGWLSDGYGAARLYLSVNQRDRIWMLRDQPDGDFTELTRSELGDPTATFAPLGFAGSRDELLFFEEHEGRTALFALDLANNRQRRLVYSHPQFDVAGVYGLGRFRRLVAAVYVDDRPQLHFYDQQTEGLHNNLKAAFPGKNVAITDESWDQRYYLVYVSSPTDAGTYYRYEPMAGRVQKITAAYPALGSRMLSPVQPVRYKAADGTEIPAYLTLPTNRSGRVPAVVLPHGGPSARDYWEYDYLAQYLAANGYAVLQANYRGSNGYGKEWRGEGGFRDWRRAIGDIDAGREYLIAEGIADPDKVCAVGWSFGGYAALLSVIENKDGYQCVASIAGVTDPKTLGNAALAFVGGRAARDFIGTDDEVRKHGSPLERAGEIDVPVLIVHGIKDLNVPLAQSTVFANALERERKDVEFIEYASAEHSITQEQYRIDLLTRLGEFLGESL